MLLFPSCAIGTVAAESVRVLGVVPPEGRGLVVAQVDVFVTVELAPDPSNYWLIEIGVLLATGSFETRAHLVNPRLGWAKGRSAIVLQKAVVYKQGEVMAVRASPTGDPSDLTECDVVPWTREP